MVGITNASIELANRLINEGHDITYLSPIDIKEKVINSGLNYVQLPEINFYLSIKEHLIPSAKKKHLIQAYFYVLTHLKTILNKGIISLKLHEYENILKKVNPDLVLVDVEVHEAILAALKLNIKTQLLSQHLFDQRRVNLPSITTGIIPKKGLSGSSIGIELSWWKLKLTQYARAQFNKLRLMYNRKSVLFFYKKKHGITGLKTANRRFPSDFIYPKFDTLFMVMPEIEFPLKKPKNIHYLGPMINTKRETSQIPEDLKKLVDQKHKKNAKLIYCSLTTMKNMGDLNFIKKLIEAVARRSDWILIISLGRTLSEEHYFNDLPENVHVYSWIPQLYILSNADCSINHGGIHTINECLYFKVPMLIYSGKKYDQDGCAARIFYHNLGLCGDKDKDDVETINYNIDYLLKNKSIQKNLNTLKLQLDIYERQEITPYLS